MLVPWIWTSQILAVASLAVLLFPKMRRRDKVLIVVCSAVVVSIWIEKGLGMVVTGFIPSPLGNVTEYGPTLNELAISLGVYGLGGLILLVLYKIGVTIREELEVG